MKLINEVVKKIIDKIMPIHDGPKKGHPFTASTKKHRKGMQPFRAGK